MSHSPFGWSLEKAHKEGFVEGYKAGTEDMRKAYGNALAGTRPETYFESKESADARLQGDVEEPEHNLCLHDGAEDASDCPNAEGELIHITVARFPPFR
jgi:hypothetical protein